MNSLFIDRKISVPESWTKITTIDLHTGGEPLRVFTSGIPELKGKTVLEKRKFFRDHFDYIRTGTLFEPRGHADMYGALLTPSIDADFDVFFLHNEGYSTMCGHAIIALTKLVLEFGLVKKNETDPQLIINVPAGKVYASADMVDGEATNIRFVNVPSFLYLSEKVVEVEGIGNVNFDIAYGGAFYAIVKADQLELKLVSEEFNKLIDLGRKIKNAVMKNFEIQHPFEKDLSFLYGTIFTGPPMNKKNHSRNVCVFAEGEVDRSATGSGVAARAALHFAKGELPQNHVISIESITGSTMDVCVKEDTVFGPHSAVITEIGGTAYITGQNEFYFDPKDPFKNGFIFR